MLIKKQARIKVICEVDQKSMAALAHHMKVAARTKSLILRTTTPALI